MNVQSMLQVVPDKRTQIIETAIDLFVTQGLQQTSMAQLSKVSEVAVGTIYHHFRSKDELIEGIFLFIQEDFGDSIRLSQEELSLSFRNQFNLVFKKAYSYYIHNPKYFFFVDTHNYSPIISNEVTKKGRKYYQQAISILDQGIERGIFKANHPVLVIRWVYNSVVSLVQLKLNDDIDVTERMVDDVIEMTWKGLT